MQAECEASLPGDKRIGCAHLFIRFTSYARRYRYVLPCDVRQFFPFIDHAILRGILARPEMPGGRATTRDRPYLPGRGIKESRRGPFPAASWPCPPRPIPGEGPGVRARAGRIGQARPLPCAPARAGAGAGHLRITSPKANPSLRSLARRPARPDSRQSRQARRQRAGGRAGQGFRGGWFCSLENNRQIEGQTLDHRRSIQRQQMPQAVVQCGAVVHHEAGRDLRDQGRISQRGGLSH